MSNSQFISVRESAQILSISEKKVMDLIEQRKLQAYRIADKFLRLKRSEVLSLRNTGKVVKETNHYSYTFFERIQDMLYFNMFYIVCSVVIFSLVYTVFKT